MYVQLYTSTHLGMHTNTLTSLHWNFLKALTAACCTASVEPSSVAAPIKTPKESGEPALPRASNRAALLLV